MPQRPLMLRTQTWATSRSTPGAVFDLISDLRAHLESSGEVFRIYANRADREQLQDLARLAEERSADRG